jgi:mono/diheme cytochrome c family protein
MPFNLLPGLLYAAIGSAALSTSAAAQQPALAQDGVYTAEQAARGRTIYKQRCATCHGNQLQGAVAPALTGERFVAYWGGPLADLADKIRFTMPADGAGSLNPQQSVDLVAHMLQVGKFPAGKTELAADEAALKRIALSKSRESAINAKVALGPAQAPIFPPYGNLAAVMRAIMFPSSNMIFHVQTNDPGAPPPPKEPGAAKSDAGFSWVDWGAGIYTGWDLVDYAAIAIAESAPLMLTPGRRCENGKLVPVDRPDWIKFALEMAEAGRAAYRASQSRNQEAVSESTNQLSDSCLNCHRTYRDIPGGKAARCVSPQKP